MSDLTVIAVLALIALYFLPSFVGNKKKNSTAIFVLNLLLGWSIIGWVVALIWAFTKDDVPVK